MDTPLERIRRAELESVRRWFKPGARVLELGGGSGFQAAIVASWGCDIVSIDLENKPLPEHQSFQRQYYPVQSYDGCHLPFNAAEFDLVFSSNMLYHAVPLQSFLAEILRVLRPGGTALHILPSVNWRLWTNVVYPFYMASLVLRKFSRRKISTASVPSEAVAPAESRRPLFLRLWRLVMCGPLGPYSSSVAELFIFRSSRWMAEFSRAGFEQLVADSGSLFYTGCNMYPDMQVAARRHLAAVLGGACYVFSMRRPTTV